MSPGHSTRPVGGGASVQCRGASLPPRLLGGVRAHRRAVPRS